MYKLNQIIIIVILLLTNFSLAFNKPLSLPQIKNWQANQGVFELNENTQIIVETKNANKLKAIAETFADDIKALNTLNLKIVSGDNAIVNSIFLSIDDTVDSITNQAYFLDINSNIVIRAISDTGVFYGTRTLLQLFKQSPIIAGGSVKDFPDYPERGLMIDNGRKFYSVQCLKDYIKELAYFKMNILHLHISDNEGFRLKSDFYPNINSEKYYNKQELKEIVELSDKYFVCVIPEIDMPNHMGQILRNLPNLQIETINGNKVGACCMDYTLDQSLEFVRNIIDEYSEIFTGKYWHIGADEMYINPDECPQFLKLAKEKIGQNATLYDSFTWFINYINFYVKTKGKILRAWSDALNNYNFDSPNLEIDKDIIFEYWEGNFSADKLLSNGNRIMNCNSDCLYYVVGTGWKPNSSKIIETWKPNIFNNLKVDIKPTITGSKVQIWADFPDALTEMQIVKDMALPIRAVAERTWNSSDSSLTYVHFQEIVDSIGYAPSFHIPLNLLPNDLALNKRAYASSVETPALSPDLAFDGDYNTRWSSKYLDTAWIFVDFGNKYHITRVKVNWEYSFAVDYQIQLSEDSTNWRTVLDIKENKGGINDFTKLNDSCRYIRIFCTKRSNLNGYSLFEIEAYDSTNISIDSNYDTDLKTNVSISPNPFLNKLNISVTLEKIANISIELYDLIGNRVAELFKSSNPGTCHTFTWYPNAINFGIYYLVIRNEDKLITMPVFYMDN
jgi:hexosaminidase